MNTATQPIVQFAAALPVNPVDKLGQLKAAIADLQAEADRISDQLRASGPGRYDGDLFAATVTDETLVETFDSKAAKAKLIELGATEQWIAGCTKVSVRKATVKVGAR